MNYFEVFLLFLQFEKNKRHHSQQQISGTAE
jgi:hypothetical protein